MPRTSNNAPVVVVALPPNTRDMLLPPFGYIERPFVDVANFEFAPPPPVGVLQPNNPDDHCKNDPLLHVESPAPYRFVVDAVVENKLVENRFVVVAELPVAFTKVRFWRVVEPVRRRFESVVSPPVTFKVPVKLAAFDIV